MVLKEYFQVSIDFSPQGHGLIGLLVSFLILNKLYLAVERYNTIRSHIGHAFISLRELNQLAITFTIASLQQSQNQLYYDKNNDIDKRIMDWRMGVQTKIFDIMSRTVDVLQDDKKACYLARNDFKMEIENNMDDGIEIDPLHYVQLLRIHLYTYNNIIVPSSSNTNNATRMELLEKVKLVDMLVFFGSSYRDLLRLASTPLPFPMIQMGRTFLFLWVYTMPLALMGLEIQLIATLAFVFFISYGYIGLELISMKLLNPFGNDVNDLDIVGIQKATELAIMKDSKLSTKNTDNNTTTTMKEPMTYYPDSSNNHQQKSTSTPTSPTTTNKLLIKPPSSPGMNYTVDSYAFSGGKQQLSTEQQRQQQQSPKKAIVALTNTSSGSAIASSSIKSNEVNFYYRMQDGETNQVTTSAAPLEKNRTATSNTHDNRSDRNTNDYSYFPQVSEHNNNSNGNHCDAGGNFNTSSSDMSMIMP